MSSEPQVRGSLFEFPHHGAHEHQRDSGKHRRGSSTEPRKLSHKEQQGGTSEHSPRGDSGSLSQSWSGSSFPRPRVNAGHGLVHPSRISWDWARGLRDGGAAQRRTHISTRTSSAWPEYTEKQRSSSQGRERAERWLAVEPPARGRGAAPLGRPGQPARGTHTRGLRRADGGGHGPFG